MKSIGGLEVHLRLRNVIASVLLVILVCAVCRKGNEPTPSFESFALTGGTLIDGTGGDPVPNAVVVIQAGRILAAGPASSTSIPENTQVIDVSGTTVLPGFFNAHVHAAFNESNLRAWARAGVTTVRDLCGPSAFDFRDALSEDPRCARLVAAGPMVSVPGGYPYVPWGSPNILPVTSAGDARQKVNQLLREGADIVKLAIESGEGFQMVIPTLTPDQAAATVETAHEYGTIASVHVMVSSDLRRALDAGVDDIAHMVVDSLPDSVVQEMVQDMVFWVPTLELWEYVAQNLRDAAIHNLRKYVLAGGAVALGTDYDGYDAPFQLGMPTREMELMLEAGMSPMQVIVAATRNAAIVCNRASDLGTLEAGKIADVLVVAGNPLDDIHVLTDVRLVVHNGLVIRRVDP